MKYNKKHSPIRQGHALEQLRQRGLDHIGLGAIPHGYNRPTVHNGADVDRLGDHFNIILRHLRHDLVLLLIHFKLGNHEVARMNAFLSLDDTVTGAGVIYDTVTGAGVIYDTLTGASVNRNTVIAASVIEIAVERIGNTVIDASRLIGNTVAAMKGTSEVLWRADVVIVVYELVIRGGGGGRGGEGCVVVSHGTFNVR